MTQFVSQSASPRAAVKPWPRLRTAAIIAAGLAAWFAWAASAGVTGLFAAGPESVFRPVLLSIAGPVAIFLAAYYAFPGFRAFVLTRDIRFLTSLQHWRVIGGAFLLLYAAGALPGEFAWPAGLGGIFIGLTAPLIMLALARRSGFAKGATFIAWNVAGLLDFVVAGTAATLASGAVPGVVAPGSLSSAPMEISPLFLFPGFIVPFFIMVHLSVLFQIFALRRAGSAPSTRTTEAPREVFAPVGAGDLPFQTGREG